MKRPYYRMAVLKGLSSKKAVWKHAFRNALLPAVTVIAINVGYIIAGMVVVEMVFAYPGIGNLVTIAIVNRDVPLILSSVFVVSGIYILANLVADVAYGILNPRIRY
jgi:peptide/nickel transport system permease protein